MQKLYYSIREAAEMVDEEQHILRYWEKEFDELSARKNRGGNRIYSEKDIFIINTIKSLLRNDKLSIQGAKEKLSEILSTKRVDSANQDKQIQEQPKNQIDLTNNSIDKKILAEIKEDLIKLKGIVFEL